MKMVKRLLLLLPVLAGGCRTAPPEERAETRLRAEIAASDGYRQVRAAEALALPCPAFPADSPEPAVRIGQYRVRVAAGQSEYGEQIRKAALDPAFPARCHALESAAKLRLAFSAPEQEKLRALAAGPDKAAAGYALWVLAANRDAEAQQRLTRELETRGPLAECCAYASGFLPELPKERRAALARLAAENNQTAAFALWALARHGAADAAEVRKRLAALPPDVPEKILRFRLAALGEAGTIEDLSRLVPYLDSPEPETVNAAAGAILAIRRKGDSEEALRPPPNLLPTGSVPVR